MSLLTTFFNLIKPAKTDGVKVSDFNANMDTIDTEMHKPPLTVNFVEPNPTTRDIHLEKVPLADNLTSEDAQLNEAQYIERTSGGDGDIADGEASLSSIKGAMVKTGYVAEVIDMTVNAAERVAPPAITAVLDKDTFEAYVETAGTYTLTYDDGAWDNTPADYGVTVSNTPVDGDEIVIVWDGENDPVMTVNAVTRPVPPAITATINKATFRAYVSSSGTITLNYTTAWSANPANYGITVTNTPVAGDQIVVEYTKLNRGTITPVKVTKFNSTGWNLYDNSVGYAKVVKYATSYGFYIGGNYGFIAFATTPEGTPSAITVTDGYFSVPSDGYVIVTGGDATTFIFATWTDWMLDGPTEAEAYSLSTVDLSEVVTSDFPNGMFAIGEVRDEINFNVQKTYSRIQRMAYTEENLATAIATGRPYDTDTNYIYLVRASAVANDFTLSGTYTVSDHGIEFYTATTTTAPITESIYGQNLKDKLRRDVLTISQQTLTSGQQAQVQNNIGLVPTQATDKTTAGFVADARVIKTLSEQIGNKVECVTDTKSGISTTAGTAYTVGAVSSYVPSGKTIVGLSKLKSAGNESGDYGMLQLNASGTNIVFMPTVTQTGVTIQFAVFYK